MSKQSDIFNQLPINERTLFRIIESEHRVSELHRQNNEVHNAAAKLAKKNFETIATLEKQIEKDKVELGIV